MMLGGAVHRNGTKWSEEDGALAEHRKARFLRSGTKWNGAKRNETQCSGTKSHPDENKKK